METNWGKGFTLIELLIIVAVLGILAAGIIVVIDPLAKINSANLAKTETFAASIQNSLAMDLVGEWTFNGNANDTSGYGNNGSSCPSFVPDRKGQASKACSFNGTSDYVDVGNGASLDVGAEESSMTIEAWVYLDVVKSSEIVAKVDQYWFEIKGNSTIEFLFLDTANGIVRIYSNAGVITAGTWLHLVAVKDGTTGRIYKNGIDATSSSDVLDDIRTTTNNLLIGSYNASSDYFNGLIDEVRIYNSALLSYQTKQLYAQGLLKHLLAFR